jgi:hypothetical protein
LKGVEGGAEEGLIIHRLTGQAQWPPAYSAPDARA